MHASASLPYSGAVSKHSDDLERTTDAAIQTSRELRAAAERETASFFDTLRAVSKDMQKGGFPVIPSGLRWSEEETDEPG